MFIVKKIINGKEYYYLRESKREKGKVKAKTIAYLGKTKKEAEKKAETIEKNLVKKEIAKEKAVKELNKKIIKKEDNKIKKEITIDELANFCKRKGFIFRSSDIYGGFAGFWDFGPLGVELFNNIKQEWWNYFVKQRQDILGIDASIISHPRTWKASGHLTSFKDIAVICKKCKKATKIDESEKEKAKCECGGEYEIQGEFNLLFKTKTGAFDSEDAYLRGETAQAMFMDFKLIAETSRAKLPFGIAQIGKCFRNEIAPRDFLFRSREFTLAEFEFFINPKEENCNLLEKKHLNLKIIFLPSEMQEKNLEEREKAKETTIKKILQEKKLSEWHAYWLAEQVLWLNSIGLKKLKIREHLKSELSHYSSATFDIDYEYPFGSKELAGNANRGQYDLTQHIKESNQDLKIFDEKTNEKVIPKVIEPTFGMERVFLAILVNAYEYDEKRQNIVLKLPIKLAPFTAAIFPIVKKPGFIRLSKKIFNELKKEFNCFYDESASLGRRYSRQDEQGTPYCITIDGDSLKNKDITIRDRDTTEQIRVKISELKEILIKAINGENFLKLGKRVVTRVKKQE